MNPGLYLFLMVAAFVIGFIILCVCPPLIVTPFVAWCIFIFVGKDNPKPKKTEYRD